MYPCAGNTSDVSESECLEPALVLAKTAELVESVSFSVLSASLGSH